MTIILQLSPAGQVAAIVMLGLIVIVFIYMIWFPKWKQGISLINMILRRNNWRRRYLDRLFIELIIRKIHDETYT